MYCFDTDVLSASIGREPPTHLIRRLSLVVPDEQATTSITLGELLYGAAKRGSRRLSRDIEALVWSLVHILPFDEPAARVYGSLRADLEGEGTPLAEPDLRIASIALARDLTLVTGNVRHFSRVPGLRVENWLT